MQIPKSFKSPWFTLRIGNLPFSIRIDRRVPLVALAIIAFTLVVLVLSINYGVYNMTPIDVIQTIIGTLPQDHPEFRNFNLVVHVFRLPRIVLAFLVGAALATSGALMQGITRNPLADPFLLGVSSGAAVVAVALIVAIRNVSLTLLPWGAFVGGTLTAGLIYFLALKRGNTSPVRLILIGIALEAVITAVTTMILLFGNINEVQQAYVWLAGSVYGRNWDHVRALGGWMLVFLPAAFLMARTLNTLNLTWQKG